MAAREHARRGAFALAGGAVLAGDDEDRDDDGDGDGDARRHRVTITNLTRGQPFTPSAIALHEPDVAVFSVGEPAPDVVGQLAENGNLDPLPSLVEETAEVRAAAPPPGSRATANEPSAPFDPSPPGSLRPGPVTQRARHEPATT